jgi:uroporphyrinogen-III synthase
MPQNAELAGLAGLRVVSFESRRAPEMAKLIESYGGTPVAAPSMREVPLESNTEAIAFARALASGEFDIVIFLTGVGTQALTRVAETVYSREQFVEALRKVTTVVRGPKPAAALKELGVPISVSIPEPNTWRDLLRTFDQRKAALPLEGRRVAVQEYGASNPELLAGLAERGARVTRVPVYQWALPADLGPLRAAIELIAQGQIDVAFFTSSLQVDHLFHIAAESKQDDAVRGAFARILVGSIGPLTSDSLRGHGIAPDFEPSHPKMGFLVNEAAQRGGQLLRTKRRIS